MHRTGVRLGLAAAVAMMAACTSDKGSTGPTNSYVGAWEGTNAQGTPVQLYVENDGVRLVVFSDTIVGTSCTSHITYLFADDPPDTGYAVVGSGFAVVRAAGGSGAVNFSGTFASTTAVTGTMAVSNTTCNGNNTIAWSASKVTTPSTAFAGTWNGTFTSSIMSATSGSFTLAQSGANLTGTWTFANGGTGTITGTIAGHLGKFSITETTPGCAGTFTGHAALLANPETLFVAWAGTDCLGTHHHAGGFATRAP